MNTGNSPFTLAGRTTCSLIDSPLALMVCSFTSIPERSTLTDAWAPVSTARASFGLSCSSGLPPPCSRASRKAWVCCSMPGLPAAKALETDRASREAVRALWTMFMSESFSMQVLVVGVLPGLQGHRCDLCVD
ncbi:hypothetical protein D3C76_1441880 [compost metagenome]